MDAWIKNMAQIKELCATVEKHQPLPYNYWTGVHPRGAVKLPLTRRRLLPQLVPDAHLPSFKVVKPGIPASLALLYMGRDFGGHRG